ncbi:condensation domain-containing protein [Bacillus stercoris]|nr:condensation domain-containing protein [Bacillus stercoris]
MWFYANVHHVISDGISMNILRNAIMHIYLELANGSEKKEKESRIHLSIMFYLNRTMLNRSGLKRTRRFGTSNLNRCLNLFPETECFRRREFGC